MNTENILKVIQVLYTILTIFYMFAGESNGEALLVLSIWIIVIYFLNTLKN
jgi:hypothetical protein